MKKIILFTAAILSANLLFAQIINIPDDYPTIQEGIDVATNGDTILAQPGTYIENINYNGKNIVVASLFITTQDTSYISQTTIDGNMSGPVITFNHQETASAKLCGFRIINGFSYGGGVLCNGANPVLQNLVISNNNHTANRYSPVVCFTNNSNAILEHSSIISNETLGIRCNESSISLIDVEILSNGSAGLTCDESDVYLEETVIANNAHRGISSFSSNIVFDSVKRCNIYSNNYASYHYANEIFSDIPLHVIVDTFSVLNPTGYYAAPINQLTFDILNGKIDQVEADLYVSPNGDNANSGLTPDDPLKNVRPALSVIYVDSLHPHNIHLLEGTYSPATNDEISPIHLFDYIHLSGYSESDVIFDSIHIGAMGKSVSLSGMTITNGSSISCQESEFNIENVTVSKHNFIFSAIRCLNSAVSIKDATITGNTGWWDGGGIDFSSCQATVENCVVSNNSGVLGGGIYCTDSDPVFKNVIISDNRATYDSINGYGGYGGGVSCYNSDPIFQNVLFTGNSAVINGSVLYLYESHPQLINATITENEQIDGGWNSPYLYLVYDDHNSSLNIINSIIYKNDTVDKSLMHGGGVDLTITYSNVQNYGNIWSGEGNIEEEPLFILSGDHPYQINDYSPCIDAGIIDTTGLNLPEFDLADEFRISNNRIDMGAYEWNMFVGIEETVLSDDQKIDICIYPNPVSENCFLEFEMARAEQVTIQVYNSVGKLIDETGNRILQPGPNQLKVNMERLSKGIYFVKLQIGNDIVTKKIIKL